jgi:hypothetical protein
MEINIDSNFWPHGPARTNFYVWKDLDHLKSYYAESIDREIIDSIAREIKTDNSAFKKRTYGMGEIMEKHLNERCFCNLVEIILIDRNKDAFERFLEKPV